MIINSVGVYTTSVLSAQTFWLCLWVTLTHGSHKHSIAFYQWPITTLHSLCYKTLTRQMRVKASGTCHQQNYQDFKTAICLNYTIKCTEKQESISTQPSVPLWMQLPTPTLWASAVATAKASCCSLGHVLAKDSKEQWLHRLCHSHVSLPVGKSALQHCKKFLNRPYFLCSSAGLKKFSYLLVFSTLLLLSRNTGQFQRICLYY